jgi:acyl carrier protein phosphodiesterase
MNFLAHAFLSGEVSELMLGNLMGDFVKGDFTDDGWSEQIQDGIALHRKIDTFTDTHPVVKQSKNRLFPTYRHYAGVIVDIFYDHFLAVDFQHYSKESLPEFVEKVYKLLHKNYENLPPKMQRTVFYMQSQNWLQAYAKPEGIERALQGMARRTTFKSKMEYAIRDLEKDYSFYKEEFEQYFPQAQQYVQVVKNGLSGNYSL